MSGLECRNVMVDGRRTSVKLDGYTWRCLQEICDRRNITVHDFCAEVKRTKADYSGFTSALRIAILRHYRDLAAIVVHPARRGRGRAAVPVYPLDRSFPVSPS